MHSCSELEKVYPGITAYLAPPKGVKDRLPGSPPSPPVPPPTIPSSYLPWQVIIIRDTVLVVDADEVALLQYWSSLSGSPFKGLQAITGWMSK